MHIPPAAFLAVNPDGAARRDRAGPRAGRDEERGRKMPGVGKGQGQGTGEAEREAPRLPSGPASRTAPPPRALCPPAAPSPLSEGRGPAPRLGLAPGAVPAPQGTSGGSLARTSLPRVVAAPTELPSPPLPSRRGWREAFAPHELGLAALGGRSGGLALSRAKALRAGERMLVFKIPKVFFFISVFNFSPLIQTFLSFFLNRNTSREYLCTVCTEPSQPAKQPPMLH